MANPCRRNGNRVNDPLIVLLLTAHQQALTGFADRRTLSPPVDPKNDRRADDEEYCTDHGPLRLPSHEAARQNVDALQKKRAADKQTHDAENAENDSHANTCCMNVMTIVRTTCDSLPTR